MDVNSIIGIFGLVLSGASLFAMLSGIRLGKRAMRRTVTVIGRAAQVRYESMEPKLPKESLFEDGPYQGGARSTPQLEIERVDFDPASMPPGWEKIRHIIRYFYKENNEIRIKEWHVTDAERRLLLNPPSVAD
jgi:hypothetical protein